MIDILWEYMSWKWKETENIKQIDDVSRKI